MMKQWMSLNSRLYNNYNADDKEIFVIFKMLKPLKKIIKAELIGF